MNNGLCDYFLEQVRMFDGIVDVVNLSGTYSRDNIRLSELLHSMNIKVKYIVNVIA